MSNNPATYRALLRRKNNLNALEKNILDLLVQNYEHGKKLKYHNQFKEEGHRKVIKEEIIRQIDLNNKQIQRYLEDLISRNQPVTR